MRTPKEHHRRHHPRYPSQHSSPHPTHQRHRAGKAGLRLGLSVSFGAALLMLAANAASAAVQINIDKNTQTMTVAVDGVQRFTFPVSSGLPAYETPSGSYKAFRMEEDHYSKEWDDAPMPHSIFFTKQGHAIHGTDVVRRLGNPASHGCVRLSRENAAKLYALVQAQGVLNTTVTLTGSSQVALARNPKPADVASAASARQPRVITPQTDEGVAADPYDYQRQAPPQGYQQNYQVYGAPRGGYVGRGYAQQQPYGGQGYAQGYVYDGTVQRPQTYYAQPYPNYPGYNRAPMAGDYSRY